MIEREQGDVMFSLIQICLRDGNWKKRVHFNPEYHS